MAPHQCVSNLSMGAAMTEAKQEHKTIRGQQGFTLVEAVISMAVLTIGLVAMLASFAVALSSSQSVQLDTIARQKATEALESIFTARQTTQLTWDNIQNVSSGTTGIFVTGMNTLTDPGPDGLDGTADDVTAANITVPGNTGTTQGTNASSATINLSSFKRQIQISNVTNSDGSVNQSLRQVTVTVQYPTANGKIRSYAVQALISQYR
jgi:Tfp pilus assembly protein PilV